MTARIDAHPLLRCCRETTAVLGFSAEDWNRCLGAARAERLLARLGYRIEDAGLLDRCPGAAQDLLLGARVLPLALQVQVNREILHIQQILTSVGADLILLKGAAYLSAGFPLSRGRRLRDLDILVRREELDRIERALLANGWESQPLRAYDQRYYRDWMHEIPPLRHRDRDVEIDVHHTILPLTSRLKPNPGLLWERSEPINGQHQVRVLSPADMVLHSATHLFQDGEIRGGLNDLWDIDALLRQSLPQPRFWDGLIERAAQMDLGRPLYYGLVFAERLLGTPVPDAVLAQAGERFAPARPVAGLMALLVAHSLPPQEGESTDGLANWLLYVRSHWLRMPPHLLLPHLLRKSMRRLDPRPDTVAPGGTLMPRSGGDRMDDRLAP